MKAFGRVKIFVSADQTYCAPVAQMDRALASEAKGREFDPHRARHSFRCTIKNSRHSHYNCRAGLLAGPAIRVRQRRIEINRIPGIQHVRGSTDAQFQFSALYR